MKITLEELGLYIKPLSRCKAVLFITSFAVLFGIGISQFRDHCPDRSLYTYLDTGFHFVVMPFFLSGLALSIRDARRDPGLAFSLGSYLSRASSRYLTILSIRVLCMCGSIAVYLLVSFATGLGLPGASQEYDMLMSAIVSVFAVAGGAWFSVCVVEEKGFWRYLGRALKVVSSGVVPAMIVLLWAGASFGANYIGGTASVETNDRLMLFYVLLNITRVSLGYACMQGIYSRYKKEVLGEETQWEQGIAADRFMSAGDSAAHRAFRLGWLSLIPPLCLLALLSGISALKKGTKNHLSAGWGILSGGLFSFFYCLLLLGAFLPKPDMAEDYDLSFISADAEELMPVCDQLTAGNYNGAEKELSGIVAKDDKSKWQYMCSRAIIHWGLGNEGKANELFEKAAELEPGQPGFYTYYGRFALQMQNIIKAEDMFAKARQLDKNNALAGRYQGLLANRYVPDKLQSSVTLIIAFLIVIVLHEASHAFAAWKLGDPTAKDIGRCSLNPIVHIDLFGTVILPAILISSGSSFVFGWAKPVPVNKENFANPEKDDSLVSFAGPAANLVIAVVAFILMLLILVSVRMIWPEAVSLNLAAFYPDWTSLVGVPYSRVLLVIIDLLQKTLYISVLLAVFNLIPVPPLDGSWILSSVLKGRAKENYEKLRPYGFVIFLVLVMSSVLDYILLVPGLGVWGLISTALHAIGFQ